MTRPSRSEFIDHMLRLGTSVPAIAIETTPTSPILVPAGGTFDDMVVLHMLKPGEKLVPVKV